MMHVIENGSDNLEFGGSLLVDRQQNTDCLHREEAFFFDWSSELGGVVELRIGRQGCEAVVARLPTVKTRL